MSYGHFYDHGLPSLIRQIRKIKKFREPKYYAVAVGRRIGIYRSWPSCKVQIDNISNAKYRCFNTHDQAIKYLECTSKEIPIPIQDKQKNLLMKKLNNLNIIDNNNNNIDSSDDTIVYIDGACWRNGLSNATAGIGIYWPNAPERNQSLTIDGRQTSIRAEIWAAIYAIRQAKQLGLKKLTIYTDSHFVIQTATVWLYKWKRNCWMTSSGVEVKNRYDIMALDEAMKQIKKIIWYSVPSHSGIYGNEQADRLANAAIAQNERSNIVNKQKELLNNDNDKLIVEK